MNDLLRKLNVLVKSSISGTAHSEPQQPLERDRRSAVLGKNLDREIASLRERVNEAIRYEEELSARLRQLEDETARWDLQADEAVAQGNEAGARYAIEHMRRAQQRATMTQVDLRAHQQATQDLIQRVNTLDAVAADARRSQAEESPSAPAEALAPAHIPDLGNVLREAREKITALGEMAAAQRDLHVADTSTAPGDAPAASEEDRAVDADLESRRQRLSKR